MKKEEIRPLRVSECVDLIRTTLSAVVGDLAVYGEVSEFQSRSQGSLVFFTIKDQESYLRCFMLQHELKVPLAEGMEIIVYGYPSLFKKNSGFHIRVKRIELKGEGALKKQFELTKKKLEAEGLFSSERKRQLPRFPEKIGIITSKDAAALTDVDRVIRNRWPLAECILADAIVQGAQAVKAIVRAIAHMDEAIHPDVIILTRGGGSIEDLQAFNSEEVARAIFSCHTPIVSGIGHERDVTIADFVADVRGATPSNAAELAVPKREDILNEIDAYVDSLEYSLSSIIQSHSHRLFVSITGIGRTIKEQLATYTHLIDKTFSFGSSILGLSAVSRERIHGFQLSLRRFFSVQKDLTQKALENAKILLSSHSPAKILDRGYSISRIHGKLVRSVKDVKKGAILDTTVSEGTIHSTINDV